MAVETAITRARQSRGRAVSAARRLGLALLAAAFGLGLWAYVVMIRMPGASFAGPFEPLGEHERAVEADLRRDVAALVDHGDRSVQRPVGLAGGADHVDRALTAAGYRVERQRYMVGGVPCDNVEAELGGDARSIVIVGAHYDSVAGTVGADDNGSGVAALLSLARTFAGKRPARTLRFVAFANEEPPYFQRASMGSVVYAKRSRQKGEDIVAVLSLETIGYYTDAPRSQHYPFPFGWFYPTTGDFVAFVGDTTSGDLVRRTVSAFRKGARFPAEGIAGPAGVPGIGWSDQWSFWQEGYRGVMVTDTAPFRYPHYHEKTDTPEKLTYAPMARVVVGIERVIEDLAGPMR